MKKIILGAAMVAVFGAFVSSCGDNAEKGKMRSLEEYKNVTAADSMIYYFGQLRAMDYWYSAKGDSLLLSEEGREQYLRGLKAGMDAAKDNDAYNQGFYVGLQLAMNLKEFKEDNGVMPNKTILINAIADGLQNDSIVDAGEAQKNFNALMKQIDDEKVAKEKAESVKMIAERAQKNGWQKFNDELYGGKVSAEGEGALLTTGKKVKVFVTIYSAGGKELNKVDGRDITVGEFYAGPVAQALLTMKMGESRVFYAPAVAMFGNYTNRYGVKATEILSFNLRVAPADAEAPAANAE